MSCKCAAAQGPPCPTCGDSGFKLVYLNKAQVVPPVDDGRFLDLFRHKDGKVCCVPESDLPVRSVNILTDGSEVQVDIVGCNGRLVLVPVPEASAYWRLGFAAFVLYVTSGCAAMFSPVIPGKIELGRQDDQPAKMFIDACRLCMQGILQEHEGAARLLAVFLRSAQRMWPGGEEVGGGGGGEEAGTVEECIATTLDLLQTSGLNWLEEEEEEE